MNISNSKSRAVHWQSVALPTEHGSWSFVGEPIILGLLLAPTSGGLALALAAFASFLLRQPLKVALKDLRTKRNTPRTEVAWRFVFLYGTAALLAALATVAFMTSLAWVIPLLAAAPFIGVQLWHDVQNRSRDPKAEFAGVAATGAIAAAIVLMSDWSFAHATGLWLAFAVKGITSVMYVRARLRLERKKPSGRAGALLAHAVGFGLLVLAGILSLVPWTIVLAMGILTTRASIGLSALRKARPPKIIGMQEASYGFMFALLAAVGYLLIW